jgi:pimeloyl-ACP methyl ester carboxylesterase
MNALRASVLGLLVLLSWLAWSGAASAASAHVYLIRGIFNVSVGLDAIAARLAQRGIAASVYGDQQGAAIVAQAVRDYGGGTHNVILVGHSLGAGTAVSVARQLAGAGVPVALMILLDPVGAGSVPPNVRRAINLYVGGRGGRAVGAEAGFRGSLSNVDVSNDPVHPDHMTIQSAPAMQNRIIAYISGAAATSEQGSARHAGRGPHRRHRA